jgi:Flp pilus assembly protein TadD
MTAQVVLSGDCEHCGARAPLASCDVREWFHLGPLPLYPLTAYRLLQQCPLCGFSRRMPLKAYRAWTEGELRSDRQAMDAAPEDRELRLKVAWKAYGLGVMYEALATLAPLLAAGEAPAAANHLAGLAWRDLGHNAAALAELREAVSKAPGEALYHLDLGRALLRDAESFDQAVDYLETATRLAPEDVEAWLALAHALTRRGRWAGARHAWERAEKLWPEVVDSPVHGPVMRRAGRERAT